MANPKRVDDRIKPLAYEERLYVSFRHEIAYQKQLSRFLVEYFWSNFNFFEPVFWIMKAIITHLFSCFSVD